MQRPSQAEQRGGEEAWRMRIRTPSVNEEGGPVGGFSFSWLRKGTHLLGACGFQIFPVGNNGESKAPAHH